MPNLITPPTGYYYPADTHDYTFRIAEGGKGTIVQKANEIERSREHYKFYNKYPRAHVVRLSEDVNGNFRFLSKITCKPVHSFETIKPERKLLTGRAGVIEKIAHFIGNNKNGAERTRLVKVAEFILNHIKK